MQAAAPKTYISKRMLDRYSEQRRIQQESQSAGSGNQAPVVPAKTFAEDADQPKTTSSVLAPIEEEKKDFEETKQNIQAEPQP